MTPAQNLLTNQEASMSQKTLLTRTLTHMQAHDSMAADTWYLKKGTPTHILTLHKHGAGSERQVGE